MTTYLQEQLALTNPLLRDLMYIVPHYLDEPKSIEAISRLSSQMLKVTKTDKFCDSVKSEYAMLMCEYLTNEKEAYLKDYDICKYWSSVSKKKDALGQTKYPSISKLVKSCLTISHGNSIPERGFSINNNIVTDERNALSEIGISSLRICKDYLKNFASVSDVIITKSMINYMQKARAEYASYLQKVKDEKQKEALKRKIEEKEEDRVLKKKAKEDLGAKLAELKDKENHLLKNQETSHSLLNEGTLRLDDAVKNNDFPGIKVAQMMLDTANSNIKNVSDELAT